MQRDGVAKDVRGGQRRQPNSYESRDKSDAARSAAPDLKGVTNGLPDTGMTPANAAGGGCSALEDVVLQRSPGVVLWSGNAACGKRSGVHRRPTQLYAAPGRVSRARTYGNGHLRGCQDPPPVLVHRHDAVEPRKRLAFERRAKCVKTREARNPAFDRRATNQKPV